MLEEVSEERLPSRGLVGDVSRLRLRYASAMSGPATIVVKRPRNGWWVSEACSRLEVDAYSALARAEHSGGDSWPRLYGSTPLASGGRMLFLEDLEPARFVTQVGGLAADQLSSAVEAIARIHRASDDSLDGDSGLLPFAASPIVGYCRETLTSYTGAWPASLARSVDKLMTDWDQVLELLSSETVPFVHGDYHAGNIAFQLGGASRFFDLQFSTRAHPAVDIARLMSTSVTISQRRLLTPPTIARYAAAAKSDAVLPESRPYGAALLWNLAVPLSLHVKAISETGDGWPLYLPILERCQSAIDDHRNLTT